MEDLDKQTTSAFDLSDGPMVPPQPDAPNNTYTPTEQDKSIWGTLRKETQDFLRKKHPYLAPLGFMAEVVGPTGAAADVRDYAQLTESAARNAVEGRIGDAAVDAGYGAAALGAAFIPGLGGVGEMRRAVSDTSLFRQNPDKGVTRVKPKPNPDFEEIDKVVQEAEQGLREFVEELSRQSGYSPDRINEDLLDYRSDPEAFLPIMIDRYGELDSTGWGDSEPVIHYLDTKRRQFGDLLTERASIPDKVGLSARNLQSFYNPVESAIENLPYNKNGTIRGDKARQFMQDKGYVSGSTFQFTFPDYSGFDPKREYTQVELQDLYKSRSFDVIGYTEAPYYAHYQRQGSEAWGEIEEYHELLIDVVPSQGSTRGKLNSASHFTDQNIAHARVSIRTADGIGVQQLIPSTERYVLVEEIQSDYVQNRQPTGKDFDSPFIADREIDKIEPEGASPVKGIGDTTRLSIMQTIMFAKENGANFVVIPSPEDIAYAGRVMEGEEIPKGFYNTYRDAVKKALSRIQQETKGQVSFGTETYTPQEEFITGEGFLEDAPMRDTPQTPRTVTIIDISKLEIDPERTELRFNKGGLVPDMEDQTMAAFGQPTEVDPMSGNPVPPGGTPEGVRDDIDAKLSEGEFIIPAHVVRFVGVTQLMQLIQAAEAGIQQMEQGGMTGQPVNDAQGDLPFDPSTLETEDEVEPGVAPSAPGFNKGGLVNESNESAQIPTVAMYRDASGFLRAVPIVNGQPVGVIPEGAQLVSGTSQPSKPKDNPRSNGSIMNENDQKPMAYDIDKLTGQEARQKLGGQKAISDFTSSRAGRATRAIGSMVPGLGQVMSFAASMQQPITNALANRVLEQDYGMKPASLSDNFRGRTSSDLTSKLGSPADALSQMDKKRGTNSYKTSARGVTPTAGALETKAGRKRTLSTPMNEGTRDSGSYSQDDLESADWGGIDDQRENDLGW